MTESSQKPSVLICGGLNTCSRPLAALLVPVDGEPLVSHLRIVDKFSVHPPTTYIGPEFPKILEKPQVEYRQANLTVESAVTSIFEPPTGSEGFDYVYDFTGEVRDDRTEVVQYNTTFCVARMLGLEAARRKVKAYIRIQLPHYETPNKPQDENADVKPAGTTGTWWHETLRALGAIEDLNLVILRVGFVYGPYTTYGIVATGVIVASVYGYMKKPMKSLWSPGTNANNTVHVDDVAGAAWALSKWVSKTGRQQANEVAGAEIHFRNDKKKIKEFQNIVPNAQKVVAPLFNLVDDTNSTLVSLGQLSTSLFGTTFEFFSTLESTAFRFWDEVEDINEQHVGGWTEMLMKSNPPITNTPLTAYMDKHALEKRTVAFNNARLKEVVGYQLKRPTINHDTIKEVVDKWKEEHAWPNL